MELNFANILWAAIAVIDVALVAVRMVLEPGPVRLSVALSIPGLIILGALINAIYNRITTGHMLESPPPRRRSRRSKA